MILICCAFFSQLSNATNNNLIMASSLPANPNPNDTVYPLQLSLMAYEYGNTFNVSCFGFKDGRIDLTVNGGTPPFTYQWSEGDTTKNIKDLPAGYYKVTVIDADSATSWAEITLTQPIPLDKLNADATLSIYPNGFNVSCINCFNGSINVIVTGGSGTYIYEWKDDGLATLNRTGLGAREYNLLIRDTNACSGGDAVNLDIALKEPPNNGWSMNGNANINANQFIGTTDESHLNFRTNNEMQMELLPTTITTPKKIKITGDADISDNFAIRKNLLVAGSFKMDSLVGQGFKLDSLSNKSYKLVFADEEGNVGTRNCTPAPQFSPAPCQYSNNTPIPWLTNGNPIAENEPSILGTCTYKPIYFKTNGEHRMIITENGNVGIGTTDVPTDYKFAVFGKILSEEVVVLLHENWPDFVFEKNYILTPLAEVEDYLIKHKHLPNVPTATEVTKNGVALGETQVILLQKIEELTLYTIEINKQVELLKKKNEEMQKELNKLKETK